MLKRFLATILTVILVCGLMSMTVLADAALQTVKTDDFNDAAVAHTSFQMIDNSFDLEGSIGGKAETDLSLVEKSDAIETGASTKEIQLADMYSVTKVGDVYTMDFSLFLDGDYDAFYFYGRNFDYVGGNTHTTAMFSIAKDGKVYSKGNVVATVDTNKWNKVGVTIKKNDATFEFEFVVNGVRVAAITKNGTDLGWFRFGLYTNAAASKREASYVAIDDYTLFKGRSYYAQIAQNNFDVNCSGFDIYDYTTLQYNGGVGGKATTDISAVATSGAIASGTNSNIQVNLSALGSAVAAGDIYTMEFSVLLSGDYDAFYFFSNKKWIDSTQYVKSPLAIAKDGKVYANSVVMGTINPAKWNKIAVRAERTDSSYILQYFLNGRYIFQESRAELGWNRFGLWKNGASSARGEASVALDDYKLIRGDYTAKVLQDMNFDNGVDKVTAADLGSQYVDSYKDAQYAKFTGDKSYVISGTSDGVNESCGRFHFTPGGLFSTESTTTLLDQKDATMEFSVAVPEGSGFRFWGVPRFIKANEAGSFDATSNGLQQYYFQMSPSGAIKVDNDFVYDVNIKHNEWIRVAFSVHYSDATYDLYVNGKEVIKGEPLSDGDYSEWNFNGFRYTTLHLIAPIDQVAKDVEIAIDDFKVYYGAYEPNELNNTEITSEEYAISDDYIYLDEPVEFSDFIGNVNCPLTVNVYTDNTYSEEAEGLFYDGVVVATSDVGLFKKYYTVKPNYTVIDEAIKTYVNDVETNVVAAGRITAEVSAFAPEYQEKSGTIILAIYKDGKLFDIASQRYDFWDETVCSVYYDIEDATGITAKAMFVENDKNFAPYIASVDFVKAN